MTRPFVTLALLLWGGWILSVAAQSDESIVDQQEELRELEQDVEASQRALDSLLAQQQRVQSEISQYDQKLTSDRQVIRRLSGELSGLQKSVTTTDSVLKAYEEQYDRRRRRYLGNIRQLYTVSQSPARPLTDHPNNELDYHRKIIYLSSLADYEASTVEDASDLVSKTNEQLAGMSDRSKMIRGLKKDRETSYALGQSQKQRNEKSLNQLKRKSMAEADRMIMLRQAAAEMAALVARLEEERARTQEREGSADVTGVSAFASLRGLLQNPYRGKVIQSFGEQIDPVTKLRSFSPGITIKGKTGNGVYLVASGTVAYAGNLRGYGNFVIINHDHQYYTTYAGLGEILVSEGQFLQGRSKVGLSGEDGIVRFELRRGKEPLDPVEWIRIESL